MIRLTDSVALQRSADCSLEWSSPVHTRSSTLALELHDSNTLIHNKAWFTYKQTSTDKQTETHIGRQLTDQPAVKQANSDHRIIEILVKL